MSNFDASGRNPGSDNKWTSPAPEAASGEIHQASLPGVSPASGGPNGNHSSPASASGTGNSRPQGQSAPPDDKAIERALLESVGLSTDFLIQDHSFYIKFIHSDAFKNAWEILLMRVNNKDLAIVGKLWIHDTYISVSLDLYKTKPNQKDQMSGAPICSRESKSTQSGDLGIREATGNAARQLESAFNARSSEDDGHSRE